MSADADPADDPADHTANPADDPADHTADHTAEDQDGVVRSLPDGLFLGIDHVGYAVPDLTAALELHARLGWLPVHRERNQEQGVEEAMLVPASRSAAAPVDPAEAQVQLLAPLSPDSPIGRYLARSGGGIQQVAYRVTDLAAVSTVLRRRGFELLHDRGRRGTAGSLINFIHPRDTGGVLIELVQRAPGGDPAGSDAADAVF